MSLDYEGRAEGVARLRVVGVGGAGGNAIRSMVHAKLRGVELLAINTDAQALAHTGAPQCLRIGTRLTRGLGAGGNPEIGLRAAEESHDAIRAALAGADMIFITAGMGGGTGTGASPAVAVTARELGALTVAIVTTPFAFEGEPRRSAAERGLAALREQVDTLIVVPNERLLQLGGQTMRMSQAYAMADDVLRQGVQAIGDLITIPGYINLDFADVRTVMADAGPALMTIGQAAGEQRAAEALRAALDNPLLELDITGARAALVNVTGGSDLMMNEVNQVVEGLREKLHPGANVLFGTVEDSTCEGQIKVTLVATGFEPRVARASGPAYEDLSALRRSAAGAAGDGGHPTYARRLVPSEGTRALPEPARPGGRYDRDEPRQGSVGDPRVAWDEPRVAEDERVPPWPASAPERDRTAPSGSLYDANDEPRAVPAQVEPGSGGGGLPAFLRPRR
jgi:cell division protein FtsZ